MFSPHRVLEVQNDLEKHGGLREDGRREQEDDETSGGGREAGELGY